MDSQVPWCIVSGFNVIYRSHFNKFGSRLTWQCFSAYAHIIYDYAELLSSPYFFTSALYMERARGHVTAAQSLDLV